MKTKKLFPSLMLLLAATFWGLSFSIQSLASSLGPFTVIFFKCVSGVILLIFAFIKKVKFNKQTIILGIVIALITSAGCVLQQKGLELTTAANTSFITVLYIVIVPLIGLFLGRKLNKKLCFAIVLALSGMFLLCIKDSFKVRFGDAIVLVAAFLFAVQIIVIDKYSSNMDAIALTAVQQSASALITGIFMIVFEKPAISEIVKFIPHILYVSLISGALGQLLQNRFQRETDPSIASLLLSFESVFGALFGWLILNQALSIKEIIGCILIFISIILA